MAGLDLGQFKHDIVIPTLNQLAAFAPGLNATWAVNLVTGTGLVESGLEYVEQLPDGPALGLCQMEPDTHDSLWANYIAFHPTLAVILETIAEMAKPTAQEMVGNNFYAVAMCRVKYFDSSFSIPSATDAVGLAQTHKTIYNTALGAADVAINTPLFQQAIEA